MKWLRNRALTWFLYIINIGFLSGGTLAAIRESKTKYLHYQCNYQYNYYFTQTKNTVLVIYYEKLCEMLIPSKDSLQKVSKTSKYWLLLKKILSVFCFVCDWCMGTCLLWYRNGIFCYASTKLNANIPLRPLKFEFETPSEIGQGFAHFAGPPIETYIRPCPNLNVT